MISTVRVTPGALAEFLLQVDCWAARLARNTGCVPPVVVTVAEEQELIWTLAVPDVAILPQLSIGGWGLDADSVKLPPPMSCPVICQVTVPHIGLGLVSVPVT